MIDRIRSFFEQRIAVDRDDAEAPATALRLAAAALLLEMTQMDYKVSAEERAAVVEAVRGHIGLSADDAEELIHCAEAERASATDYYQFTSLINHSYSVEQKVHLIELLWRIAYADDSLHKYEEHFVRRIADLIHVPHREFISAKHRVSP